jgi:hypothetical protein
MVQFPTKKPPLAMLLCLLTLPTVGCGGGGGSAGSLLPTSTDADGAAAVQPVIVTATFSSNGGNLKIDTGRAAGFALSVPQGALSELVKITCQDTGDLSKTLYAPSGPAVHCTPDDLLFDVTATVTLPYDHGKLPSGGASALSVLQKDAGEVTVNDEVTPEAGALRLQTYRLGTFQAAKVAPMTGRG